MDLPKSSSEIPEHHPRPSAQSQSTRNEIAMLKIPRVTVVDTQYVLLKKSSDVNLSSIQNPLLGPYLPHQIHITAALQAFEKECCQDTGLLVYNWGSYSYDSLINARKYHNFLQTVNDVSEEKQWFQRLRVKKFENINNVLDAFKKLLWHIDYNTPCIKGLSPMHLRYYCCSNWYSESNINAIFMTLNEIVGEKITFHLIGYNPSKSQTRFHVFGLNVKSCQNGQGYVMTEIWETGSHWVLVIYDAETKTIYFGDGFRRQPPKNLQAWVFHQLGIKSNGCGNSHKIKSINSYLFQKDSHSCGPLLCVMAHQVALACDVGNFLDAKSSIPKEFRSLSDNDLRIYNIFVLMGIEPVIMSSENTSESNFSDKYGKGSYLHGQCFGKPKPSQKTPNEFSDAKGSNISDKTGKRAQSNGQSSRKSKTSNNTTHQNPKPKRPSFSDKSGKGGQSKDQAFRKNKASQKTHNEDSDSRTFEFANKSEKETNSNGQHSSEPKPGQKFSNQGSQCNSSQDNFPDKESDFYFRHNKDYKKEDGISEEKENFNSEAKSPDGVHMKFSKNLSLSNDDICTLEELLPSGFKYEILLFDWLHDASVPEKTLLSSTLSVNIASADDFKSWFKQFQNQNERAFGTKHSKQGKKGTLYTLSSECSCRTKFSKTFANTTCLLDCKAVVKAYIYSTSYLSKLDMTFPCKVVISNFKTICKANEMQDTHFSKLNSNESIIYDTLPAGYKYIIVSQTQHTQDNYLGAQKNPFDCNFYVIEPSISDDQDDNGSKYFETWLRDFQETTKTTYRVTRTFPKNGPQCLYRTKRHCQHRTLASSNIKKKSTPNLSGNQRDKKADCESVLKCIIFNKDHAVTHNLPSQCYIELKFHHSHPLDTGHVLSFRDIGDETKNSYYKLFFDGHSPSSSKLLYESELLNSHGKKNLQKVMADRKINPRSMDVNNLYQNFKHSFIGPQKGEEVFDHLEKEIVEYNTNNAGVGKAFIQKFHQTVVKRDDSENTVTIRETPLIIAICTPVMSRVHGNVQQAAEMVFCDSTSSLDTCSCSTFILSTSSPVGALPLGILITSSETTDVLTEGFSQLSSILPLGAFFNKGSHEGPELFMTDDCASERNSLTAVWKKGCALLCIFHIFQSVWRWLWAAKNNVLGDRATLMNLFKQVVYAKNEETLMQKNDILLAHAITQQNPQFIKYYQNLWKRRSEWALAFRNHLPTRGHHTNNYSEASIRILKDFIFQRTKAYNVTQLFHFFTESFEDYLVKRLLSVASQREEYFISAPYLGSNYDKVDPKLIEKISSFEYVVISSSDQNKLYSVDLETGTCTCPIGINGQLCKHQAAVLNMTKSSAPNAVPINAYERHKYAKIALGEDAMDSYFSVTLKEKIYPFEHEEKGFNFKDPASNEHQEENEDTRPRDFFQAPDIHDNSSDWAEETNEEDIKECERNVLRNQLDLFYKTMMHGIENGDHIFHKSLGSFLKKSLRLQPAKALQDQADVPLCEMSSFLRACIRNTDRITRSNPVGGKISRHILFSTKRIPVNSTGCSRRRPGITRGKGTVKTGRPMKGKPSIRNLPSSVFVGSKHCKKNKRTHSFAKNVSENQIN